jgi:DNA processing protein
VSEIRELWGETAEPTTGEPGEDRDRQRLLDALSTGRSITVTEIARRSGLAPDQVTGVLGFLELEGRVRQHAGGWLRAPGGK